MRRFLGALLCLMALAPPALAQTFAPGLPVTDLNPYPVKVMSGGSSSGGSTPTGTAGSPNSSVVTVQGIAGGTPQPISAAALPLPTGAATAAKQPALGTAGTPATDVISVQGVTGGTPQPVVLTAGSAIAGNFRIDQTTPGTTNGVYVNSSALPTGAATSALQTSGNTTLSTISGQLPTARGAQATAGAIAVSPATDSAPFPMSATPSALAAAGVAPATVANASSQVAKASAGNLYGLSVDNAQVAGVYALVYNATAAPASGATLTASLIVWHALLPGTASTNGSLDKVFTPPLYGTTGLVILYSTSTTTFSPPGTPPLLSTAMVK